jgi:hypothetical protein
MQVGFLNTTTATWHSPIGDAPDLTAAQESQNTAGTHRHRYEWNEAVVNLGIKLLPLA